MPTDPMRESVEEVFRTKQMFTEVEATYHQASADLHQALKRAADAGVSRAVLGRAMGVSRERVVSMLRHTNAAPDSCHSRPEQIPVIQLHVTQLVTQHTNTDQHPTPPTSTNPQVRRHPATPPTIR